ncbi:hypothetical protein HAX54_023074, partial [Datura stramonium]|nr:hypothetical protein [Datura stramonium]
QTVNLNEVPISSEHEELNLEKEKDIVRLSSLKDLLKPWIRKEEIVWNRALQCPHKGGSPTHPSSPKWDGTPTPDIDVAHPPSPVQEDN